MIDVNTTLHLTLHFQHRLKNFSSSNINIYYILYPVIKSLVPFFPSFNNCEVARGVLLSWPKILPFPQCAIHRQ